METQQQDTNHTDASLVVVWQPDGSLAIGADPAWCMHKEPTAAANSRPSREPTAEETAAAQATMEERRAAAAHYRRTTLRQRQSLFMALTVCDLLFFLGTLIYQAWRLQQTHRQPWADAADNSALGSQLSYSELSSRRLAGDNWDDKSSTSSMDSGSFGGSSRNLHIAWWLDPKSLRMEDVVFSIALDLLGIIGAVQLRTVFLSLYCIIQVLSTAALSTIAGISLSLFTLFRLGLLLLAFYLRSAVMCYTSLLEAAELWLTPSVAARVQRAMSVPALSTFLRALFGPSANQLRTDSNRNVAVRERGQESSAVPVNGGSSHSVLLHDSSNVLVPAAAAAAIRRSSSAGGSHQVELVHAAQSS